MAEEQDDLKISENIRAELRRGASDFIGEGRAYYVYFISKDKCVGSAKMTAEFVIPVQVSSRTKKEEANYQRILAVMEEDLKCLAGLLDESGENRGEIEHDVSDLWIIKKRGRPLVASKPLARTTILLTEEDKEKLKELGGSAWIRDQIRKAYNESKASEE